MENVTRVGIDLGKQVFHVTAVDAAGAVVERKRLRRAGLQSYLRRLPRGCVVAMESCGGAHHWARQALWHGHEALLMSPQFVKPYVKSNKNDVADADAIAEASTRPSMRFVGVKSAEQECIQQVHRARQMALKHLTAQRNQLHWLSAGVRHCVVEGDWRAAAAVAGGTGGRGQRVVGRGSRATARAGRRVAAPARAGADV